MLSVWQERISHMECVHHKFQRTKAVCDRTVLAMPGVVTLMLPGRINKSRKRVHYRLYPNKQTCSQ